MKNKNPSDQYFEDETLLEALLDLKDYGIRIDIYTTPIIETWIRTYREDFRFRNFIKKRINIFQKKNKRRYINIMSKRKKRCLHLHFEKAPKYQTIRYKIFYKIRRKGK